MQAQEQHKPENQRDEAAEDFDLLTFGEARARLAGEVDAQQARLTELRAGGAPEPQIAAADARVAALTAALQRNRAGRITAENAADFFGTHRPDA